MQGCLLEELANVWTRRLTIILYMCLLVCVCVCVYYVPIVLYICAATFGSLWTSTAILSPLK